MSLVNRVRLHMFRIFFSRSSTWKDTATFRYSPASMVTIPLQLLASAVGACISAVNSGMGGQLKSSWTPDDGKHIWISRELHHICWVNFLWLILHHVLRTRSNQNLLAPDVSQSFSRGCYYFNRRIDNWPVFALWPYGNQSAMRNKHLERAQKKRISIGKAAAQLMVDVVGILSGWWLEPL